MDRPQPLPAEAARKSEETPLHRHERVIRLHSDDPETGQVVSPRALTVTALTAETPSLIAVSDQSEPRTPTRLALRSTLCITYGDP